MSRWKHQIIRILVPLAAAYAIIALEGPLADLARVNPGVLPVAMVALVACLLLPAVRLWLIVTLSYGIALLAWRDTFRIVPLPPAIDYVIVERLYPFGWALLGVLAFCAGVVESIRPGSVWARRCYFAAAALYFGGHGVFSFVKSPNWQSAIMIVTGLIAILGIFTAQRVVASESESGSKDEDILAIEAETRRRQARLADREWREAPENVTPVR